MRFNSPAPFPGHSHGDETPSAYMNTSSTAFFCHSCKKGGNAIHFLSNLEGISPLLAARFLRERYDSAFREPDGGFSNELDELWHKEQPQETQSNQPIDESHCDSRRFWDFEGSRDDQALLYLENRGFSHFTIDNWKLGYCDVSDRVSIPIRNEDGELIGFKGRAYRPDHKPKYLVLGDRQGRSVRYGFPTYEKARVVFGLDRAKKYDELILVEGELNVVALWQMGYRNAVSINGSALSVYQRRTILSSAKTVILFYDSDKAGHAATIGTIEALEPYMTVKVVKEHDGDPASLDEDTCYDLLDSAQGTTELWLPSEIG